MGELTITDLDWRSVAEHDPRCQVTEGGFSMSLHIDRARRGQYRVVDKPVWHGDRKWLRCEHRQHRGVKRKIPVSAAVLLVWHLNDDEFQSAIEDGDFLSMEMPPKIICRECYEVYVNRVIQ